MKENVIDMSAFVERVRMILNEQHKSPSRMARDLGFSSGLFTQWKTGMQSPSADKLVKIAAYLGVSTDYLLGVDPHIETADIRRTIQFELESLSQPALERILDYVRFTVQQEARKDRPIDPLPPKVD